jgi:MFS family permease
MAVLLRRTWTRDLGNVSDACVDGRPRDYVNANSLNAIQNIGQLAALPFCAFACDKFGRVRTLVFGATLVMGGVALQGAAQTTGMFIAARGVLGFGLAFNITAAPILLLELAYPTQRSPMVSIYNALWYLGAIAAAWITYGTFVLGNSWSWRIPSILQGLVSVIQLGSCFFLVESPRWLMSTGKEEQSRRIITKYHANGDPTDPMVDLEIEEIRVALHLEAELAKDSKWIAFFKTKGNRKRLLIILCVGFFSQWSGNGLTSYYLSIVLDSIGYTSSETQSLINGLLQIWGLVTSCFFALMVNKFGRRTLFLTSTGAVLITFVSKSTLSTSPSVLHVLLTTNIVWTALQATYDKQTANGGEGNPHIASGILAMIFLYSLAFNIGWNPLQVTYVIEILPYHLRAKVKKGVVPLSSFSVADDLPHLGPSLVQPLRRCCTGLQPIRKPYCAGRHQMEM